MFERFTDRARRALVIAQEEARALDHDYIGTEHLLLGLIQEGEGVAARALESLGVNLDSVRQGVVEIIGQGQQAPSGHIPFTPRAKKVLELSLREALQLGHNYIGTEHVLLGLMREGQGVGVQVLQGLGVELAAVRQRVIELLGGEVGTGEPAPVGAWFEDWPPTGVAQLGPWHRPAWGMGLRGGSLPHAFVLAIGYVLVTIAALLVARPPGVLARAGLIVLIVAVSASILGAMALTLQRSLTGRDSPFRWTSVALLMLFAASAVLFLLDAVLG